MKTLPPILTTLLILITLVNTPAQERHQNVRDVTFEEFRQHREQDFQNFVEQRERELRQMEQAYQDYYNELHGLRNYYVAKNDTAGANIVEEIIEFENDIARATGKDIEVTEIVEIEPEEEITEPDRTPTYPETPPHDEHEKSLDPTVYEPEDVLETTFVPLLEEGSSVPVLTPLMQSKAKVTSPFGMRNHPTLNRRRMHNGIDFGSGMNAQVYAAADGKVKLAQYSRSFGNWIILEHKNGYSSVYAHLNSFNVRKGDNINKGDIIGYSGSTGRSTGPHLHYEVRINGTPVNPIGYLTEVLE